MLLIATIFPQLRVWSGIGYYHVLIKLINNMTSVNIVWMLCGYGWVLKTCDPRLTYTIYIITGYDVMAPPKV